MSTTESPQPTETDAQSIEFECPVCVDPFDREYCHHEAAWEPLARALCVHFQGDEENWGWFLDDAGVLFEEAGEGPYALVKLYEGWHYEHAFVVNNLVVTIPPGGKDTKGDPEVVAKLPVGVLITTAAEVSA